MLFESFKENSESRYYFLLIADIERTIARFGNHIENKLSENNLK